MRYVEAVMLIHFQRSSLMVLRDWERGRMRIDLRSAIELELVRSKSSSAKEAGSLLSVLDYTCTRIGKHGLVSEIVSPVCDVVSLRG
jgi:DNA mismatch repair ATPase MutS